jgi:hypothetical protein
MALDESVVRVPTRVPHLLRIAKDVHLKEVSRRTEQLRSLLVARRGEANASMCERLPCVGQRIRNRLVRHKERRRLLDVGVIRRPREGKGAARHGNRDSDHSNGEEVTADPTHVETQSDRMPIVNITGSEEGVERVRHRMGQCSRMSREPRIMAFTLFGRCSECVRGRLPVPEALRDELGALLLAPAVQHLEL